jgi:hypothetical protein
MATKRATKVPKGIKLSIDVALKGFYAPEFVHANRAGNDVNFSDMAIPLSALSVEMLSALCDDFRRDVFVKANKRDPATQ